jgi:suppressor of G2 allele of SKP1
LACVPTEQVEVVLSKAQATAWPTLTRSSSTPAPILSSNPIASSQATKTKPTRNKFDTFEDEEVEETPGGGKSEKDLEDFFKSLYGDLDEEGKRAMMKSFSESGGTVLSTVSLT